MSSNVSLHSASSIMNNVAGLINSSMSHSTNDAWRNSILSDVKELVASGISSANNMQEQNTAQTFKFNHDEAVAARQWEKEMSDTSHQREVADLKAAGLNPVLSINNGANSYSTQSASATADNSAQSAIAGLIGTLSNTASSIMSNMIEYDKAKLNANAAEYAAEKSYESAKLSSAATKYAADQNYKSSIYGSDSSYKASIYGSDKSYNASKYVSDQSFRASKYASDASMWNAKYSSDKSYQSVMDRPANNVASLIDKYLGSGSLRDAIQQDILGYGSGTIPAGDVKNRLQMLGIKNTTANRQIYRAAVKLHNPKALKKLNSLYNKAHK